VVEVDPSAHDDGVSGCNVVNIRAPKKLMMKPESARDARPKFTLKLEFAATEVLASSSI
jgi:hypothetical protein